jgi:hypothetical protein
MTISDALLLNWFVRSSDATNGYVHALFALDPLRTVLTYVF